MLKPTHLFIVLVCSLFSLLLFSFNDKETTRVSSHEEIINLRKSPDTSFNGFCLENSTSILHQLAGETLTLNDEDSTGEDSINQFNYAALLSSAKTEILKMYLYPGSGTNQFSKFSLQYIKNTQAPHRTFTVLDNSFVATNGAYLGMPEKELTKKYGFTKNNMTYNGLMKVFGFELDSNSLFIQHNDGDPPYTAKYYLKNDTVVKIEFGFVYP